MSPEPTLSTIPRVSTRHAACSCEQLRLTVEGEPVRVSICHCLACQRRTGSVFGVQARFDAEQVTTEGASRQYIRVSDEGEKRAFFHFCPDCGATVFYTTEATPGIVAVPVGSLRGSFFPCADEVGLGGAATFVAAASRRHRTRELTGGEVTRLGERSGMSPERDRKFSPRR
jgi:hypothetical protein